MIHYNYTYSSLPAEQRNTIEMVLCWQYCIMLNHNSSLCTIWNMPLQLLKNVPLTWGSTRKDSIKKNLKKQKQFKRIASDNNKKQKKSVRHCTTSTWTNQAETSSSHLSPIDKHLYSFPLLVWGAFSTCCTYRHAETETHTHAHTRSCCWEDLRQVKPSSGVRTETPRVNEPSPVSMAVHLLSLSP